MKNAKRIFTALMLSVFIGSVAFASFPYAQDVDNSTQTEVAQAINNDQVSTVATEETAATAMDQELLITILLWFFLGGLAAHRWYKGKPAGWNVLFILTGGGCGVWMIVDLINILTGNF